MLEDIRTYARLQLEINGMTRDEYIAAVRKYVVDKYGEKEQLIAERTARYIWAMKPRARG
jgi:hypothetical protein